MSGKYDGYQAIIDQIHPLGTYFRCGAHVTHLVTSRAFQTSTVVRKAPSSVRKLGVSYSDSGRLKCLSLRSGVSKCERIETSLSKYMIAWASAVQKCPDELRRCPPSIRTA